MYNAKQIQKYIDKINTLAQKAAQDIYNQHEYELIKRIENQINSGDEILIGMGTAIASRYSLTQNINEDFLTTLAMIQYNRVYAGFNLESIKK